MNARATPPCETTKASPLERREPGAQALDQHRVAFAARRNEVPFVGAARRHALRVARPDLRPGEPLPVAEGDLHQRRVEAIALRRQVHRRANDLHRLARALERRSDEGAGRLEPVDLGPDAGAQRPPDRARLIAPARVERNVALALQPVLGVVGRLAVAHENDPMRKGHVAKSLSKDKGAARRARRGGQASNGRMPHFSASARHSATDATPSVVETARIEAAAEACASRRQSAIGQSSCRP